MLHACVGVKCEPAGGIAGGRPLLVLLGVEGAQDREPSYNVGVWGAAANLVATVSTLRTLLLLCGVGDLAKTSLAAKAFTLTFVGPFRGVDDLPKPRGVFAVLVLVLIVLVPICGGNGDQIPLAGDLNPFVNVQIKEMEFLLLYLLLILLALYLI